MPHQYFTVNLNNVAFSPTIHLDRLLTKLLNNRTLGSYVGWAAAGLL